VAHFKISYMVNNARSGAVGDLAPEFKLQNENEEWVTLAELTASSALMVVFYPGDFTPVCTKQLCAYQDAYDSLVKYGVDIVGISANPPEDHQRFKSRYQFGFHLLSDPDKQVFRAFGVTSFFMLGGTSRAVFVIGKRDPRIGGSQVLYRYVEPTVLSYRKPGQLLEGLDKLRASGQI
jgi:thioredoxin-dependent peroxiredoxin